jgi:hypothetical protein
MPSDRISMFTTWWSFSLWRELNFLLVGCESGSGKFILTPYPRDFHSQRFGDVCLLKHLEATYKPAKRMIDRLLETDASYFEEHHYLDHIAVPPVRGQNLVWLYIIYLCLFCRAFLRYLVLHEEGWEYQLNLTIRLRGYLRLFLADVRVINLEILNSLWLIISNERRQRRRASSSPSPLGWNSITNPRFKLGIWARCLDTEI